MNDLSKSFTHYKIGAGIKKEIGLKSYWRNENKGVHIIFLTQFGTQKEKGLK
jgi:hypothetical protein